MFPDRSKLDKASRKHGVPDDFLAYYNGDKRVPILIYIIKGNHEDFDFLEGLEGEIVPGMHYVPQGSVLVFDGIRFGFIGGNYSPKCYDRGILPQGGRRRHFLKKDVEAIERQILFPHQETGFSTRRAGRVCPRKGIQAVP